MTTQDTASTCHLWAHKAQDRGQNNGRTVFFEDPEVIYSYGSHFPMARHVTDRDGRDVVLVTTDTHSVTTAKHMNRLRYAVNHMVTFDVPDVWANDKPAHRANLEHMRQDYEQEVLKAGRARVYADMHLENAATLLQSCRDYSHAFKLGARIPAADVETITARAKQQDARARQREFDAAVTAWRAGERDTLPNAYGRPAVLRVSPDGATVQTSQGARFPVSDARRAIPAVMRCKDRGQAWRRNGERVPLGPYQLDSISEAGDVVAGCHRVEYAEVARLAAALTEHQPV